MRHLFVKPLGVVVATVLALGLALGVSTAAADEAPPTVTVSTPSSSAPTGAAGLSALIGSGGVPVCGDQSDPGTLVLNCQQFTQVDGTRYYQVPGSGDVNVDFNYVYREAACQGQLAVFVVDDLSGSINSVLPGDSAWPAQVAARNPQVVFGPGSTPSTPDANVKFQGGSILAFRFSTGCGSTYYSFEQANNGTVRMKAFQNAAGQPWQLAWEDGGDFDYNDMVVNVSTDEQTVTTPPTVDSFTADSPWTWSDSSITLSWSCTNADNASISSSPSSGGASPSLGAAGSWVTPALPADTYTYTVTCSNAAGSASATTSVGVFSAGEQVVSDISGGQNTDPPFTRSIQSPPGCRWKSETNTTELKTISGLRAGGLSVRIDWCVRGGKILKVVRAFSVIGPNYPFSGWKFNGITSNGPCDENCSNYVTLYGTNRTEINIWMQGHWSLCLSIPVVGSLCSQEAFRKVGVLIRGDGTRVDTYNS